MSSVVWASEGGGVPGGVVVVAVWVGKSGVVAGVSAVAVVWACEGGGVPGGVVVVAVWVCESGVVPGISVVSAVLIGEGDGVLDRGCVLMGQENIANHESCVDGVVVWVGLFSCPWVDAIIVRTVPVFASNVYVHLLLAKY